MSSTDPRTTTNPDKWCSSLPSRSLELGKWDAVSQRVAPAVCELASDVGEYEHTRLPWASAAGRVSRGNGDVRDARPVATVSL